MQASMPKTVRTSLWLFIGACVLPPLAAIVGSTPFPKLPPATLPVVLMTIFTIGLMLFLALMTYRRRNWARWVHSSVLVFGSLLLLPSQMRDFSSDYAVSPLDVLVFAAEVISIVLLFVPRSNAWYSEEVQVLPNNSLQRDRLG